VFTVAQLLDFVNMCAVGPERIDVFVPSWHEFKKALACSVIHDKPFLLPCFYRMCEFGRNA